MADGLVDHVHEDPAKVFRPYPERRTRQLADGAWKAVGVEDPALGIPTTYYGAVQLTGAVTRTDEPDEVAAVLRRQLAALESGSGAVDPSAHGGKLRTIRGLRLDIDDVRAKFKYGGNVDAAHREAVAARLAERGGGPVTPQPCATCCAAADRPHRRADAPVGC